MKKWFSKWIHRRLCYKKSFWGFRACRGYEYWRLGFGSGFIEIGGSCAGIWLPKKDAIPGKARALTAAELLALKPQNS